MSQFGKDGADNVLEACIQQGILLPRERWWNIPSSTAGRNRVPQPAWMRVPWGKQSWREEMCTAEAVVSKSCASPRMKARPLAPAPPANSLLLLQQTGTDRKLTNRLQWTQTWGQLRSFQSFSQKPKQQDHLVTWTNCSISDKPEVGCSGSGKAVTLTGNSPVFLGSCRGLGGWTAPAQPGVRVSRVSRACGQGFPFRSSRANPRLLPGCFCFCREKWHFGGWELEWKQYLSSWNLLWDWAIFPPHSSRVSLLLLSSSDALIPKALVTLYQNLGVLVTCPPAMALHSALLTLSRWRRLD